MSGMFNPATDGSNSNVPDTRPRPFGTPYSPQSGSSSGVLNHLGETVQGLHHVHGNVNISNVPQPYASRYSVNTSGFSPGVQQTLGSTSFGRLPVNNPHNALSQLSLGSSHGYSAGTNADGYGRIVLPIPNVGNAGRVSNVVDNLVGGDLGFAGVANQAGPSSGINLTAPQMITMQESSYSAQSMPLHPSNYYNYMTMLNDESGFEEATFNINDYQLYGHQSFSGSQAHGFTQNHSIGYSQHNQEFNIQNEKLPSLEGILDDLSALGFSEFPANTHQKEKLHDNMANLMQYQQMAQYQQYQPSHSYFANQLMDNHMQLQSVPNQFGMYSLLKLMKNENPDLTSLAVGTDLTTLGLNLMSTEPLHKTFTSPWTDKPTEEKPEYSIPECYNDRQSPPLKQSDFKRFQPDTLLYIFYSMPKDKAQLFAAYELYTRGWFFHRELRLWFTRARDTEPLLSTSTSTYEKGSYLFFNPNTWKLRRKDSFVLHYDNIERLPSFPRD